MKLHTACFTLRLLLGLTSAGLSLGLLGCANNETASEKARPPVAERAETQTGSNLPRKADKPSRVVTVDPESIQGAARGATRNSSTGP